MAESFGGLRRIYPVLPLIFSLWTLFVWGGRLRNLWQEPGSLADVSRWSLIGSLVFCALSLIVVVFWLMARSGGSRGLRAAVGALAGFTTAIWLVRAVDIALGDHSTAFIAVHLLLALVSIGLGVLALLAARSAFRTHSPLLSSEPGPAPVR